MDETPDSPTPLTIGGTFGDALSVYRLLFQRSVLTAALVYAVTTLVEIAHHATSSTPARGLAVLAFVLTLAAPLLVQGALVEIVRAVHEGRPPEEVGELLASAKDRFWRLLGASLLYGFGVIVGLVLLVVPGLVIAARWGLLAPLIVLEGRPVGEARARSSSLVTGQTGKVLVCIVLSFLLIDWFFWLPIVVHLSFATRVFVTFVWSALTAPFEAHVLSVIYYRLADPSRPVIDPAVRQWRSVWTGR